jgi:hypothetical protein
LRPDESGTFTFEDWKKIIFEEIILLVTQLIYEFTLKNLGYRNRVGFKASLWQV